MKIKFLSAVIILISTSQVYADVQPLCHIDNLQLERSRHKYYEIYSDHIVNITNTHAKTTHYNIHYHTEVLRNAGIDNWETISNKGYTITLDPGQSFTNTSKIMGGFKFAEKGNYKYRCHSAIYDTTQGKAFDGHMSNTIKVY